MGNSFIEDFPTVEERAILKLICENSLKAYIKIMHYYTTGSHFTFKDFHNEVIEQLEKRAKYETTKNLLLNLPVGFGKSIIVEYFVSWTFARNKNICHLYTSYSDKLIVKLSSEIMDLMKSEPYKILWGYSFKRDKQSKANWSIEGSIGRAGLTAGSIGGTITGLDCFEYNELIATNYGWLKIGDIVENKKDVKILSYNLNKKKTELKPITKYIKKQNSDIVELILNNGLKIHCTPTHYFYTQRGYIMAKDLQFSDVFLSYPFNNINRTIEFFNKFFIGIVFITYFVNFILAKDIFSTRNNLTFNPYSFCNISPIFPTFDRCYVSVRNAIFQGYNFCRSIILSNLNSLSFSKFKNIIGIMSITRTSMMFDCVKHIFRPSTISKIFNIVIKFITIKMSNIHFRRSFANKIHSDQDVNKTFKRFSIFAQGYNFISSCANPRFKDFSFYKFFSTILKNISSFATDFTIFSNTIKSFISDNRKPLIIRNITHNKTSYCVSVQCNYNLYIGGNQGILASNCGNPAVEGFSGALLVDDILKAGDEIYETKRDLCIEYYDKKLTTRLRRADVPTIIIMQRLHEEDLSGYIMNEGKYGKDLTEEQKESWKNKWDVIKIRALEDEKSIWEEKVSTAELLDKRDKTPFVFYPQYQQEPNSNINSSFKGLNFAEKDEEKNIFNGFSHTDKGFDGSDGTAFTIINKVGDTYYVFGKLWQEKHVDDCLNEMSFFRQKYMSGMNYTEKNDDKGYMGRNFPNTSTYQETQNKHFKIMTYLYPAWKNIKFIEGTDEAYIRQIQSYNEHAKHDDAPDSLASAIRLFETRTKVIGMRPF